MRSLHFRSGQESAHLHGSVPWHPQIIDNSDSPADLNPLDAAQVPSQNPSGTVGVLQFIFCWEVFGNGIER
ncbi:MAG: hypothetical protein J1E98_14445 [Lachnospiraceae bacterium]|nr:hypothetical protein [Lachnospiraceae bacterium]